MRRTSRLATALISALALLALPAPSLAADEGWHEVHEQWQPYPEGGLFLPAARYCGDFDVTSEPTYADVQWRAT